MLTFPSPGDSGDHAVSRTPPCTDPFDVVQGSQHGPNLLCGTVDVRSDGEPQDLVLDEQSHLLRLSRQGEVLADHDESVAACDRRPRLVAHAATPEVVDHGHGALTAVAKRPGDGTRNALVDQESGGPHVRSKRAMRGYPVCRVSQRMAS